MNVNSWNISRRINTVFAACLLITAGLEIFAARQINNLNTNVEDQFPAQSKPKTRFPKPGDQPFKLGSADGEFENF
jgi:hypothetical protein